MDYSKLKQDLIKAGHVVSEGAAMTALDLKEFADWCYLNGKDACHDLYAIAWKELGATPTPVPTPVLTPVSTPVPTPTLSAKPPELMDDDALLMNEE